MLSVGERDASVVRTGPKSSAIITAPGEKCGLGVSISWTSASAKRYGLTRGERRCSVQARHQRGTLPARDGVRNMRLLRASDQGQAKRPHVKTEEWTVERSRRDSRVAGNPSGRAINSTQKLLSRLAGDLRATGDGARLNRFHLCIVRQPTVALAEADVYMEAATFKGDIRGASSGCGRRGIPPMVAPRCRRNRANGMFSAILHGGVDARAHDHREHSLTVA